MFCLLNRYWPIQLEVGVTFLLVFNMSKTFVRHQQWRGEKDIGMWGWSFRASVFSNSNLTCNDTGRITFSGSDSTMITSRWSRVRCSRVRFSLKLYSSPPTDLSFWSRHKYTILLLDSIYPCETYTYIPCLLSLKIIDQATGPDVDRSHDRHLLASVSINLNFDPTSTFPKDLDSPQSTCLFLFIILELRSERHVTDFAEISQAQVCHCLP